MRSPLPPPTPRFPDRLRPSAPWLAAFAASILFRLPPLINAPGTNSDAAIVGIQAMHILRGEWSWFLLGSGYQTSVDAQVAALFFLLTGPSPLVLMLSTLLGHILLTWFVYATLRRHLSALIAAVLVTPLIFTPDPVHTYVLYPPRQASLTLVFASLWILDGASSSERPERRFALGAAVAMLAVFADPYALLFLPIVGIHGLFASLEPALAKTSLKEAVSSLVRPEVRRRLIALVGGALVGAIPYWLLTHSPHATHGQTSLALATLSHNYTLLAEDCLPWLLSYKVFAAKHMSDYAPWEVGPVYHAFQTIAAIAIMAGILSGAVLLLLRRIPWEVRRLGAVGVLALPVTIGGFLVSPMVMDHFSSRYLASILLMAPFALAPVASLLGAPRFAAALAPYLVSAAVSGWVSYAPFGVAVHPSLAVDERLGAALRERGIRYAMADYWASYRLTFLYREAPIVVPTNEVEDRYRPYRDRFLSEPVVAYIHDAFRSRENMAEAEQRIQRDATEYEPLYDRFEVGQFTVLILKRKAEDVRSAGLQ
jgi:hypothetical protein